MSLDAPDWQRIVRTVPEVDGVPDAPDWERIVVGPGGGPVPVASGGTTNIYLGGGFLGITTDPAVVSSTGGHLEGAIGFMAFSAFATGTVNNIYVPIGSSTGGFTPNENFVGIYDMGITTAGAFTLLATSATGACDTVFNTSGMHKVALTSGAPVVQGGYYAVAFLNNGGAGSFYFSQAGSNTLVDPVGTTWPVRCVTVATTHTTLASSVLFTDNNFSADTWLFYASV